MACADPDSKVILRCLSGVEMQATLIDPNAAMTDFFNTCHTLYISYVCLGPIVAQDAFNRPLSGLLGLFAMHCRVNLSKHGGGAATLDSSNMPLKLEESMAGIAALLTDTGSGVTSSVQQIKMAGSYDTLMKECLSMCRGKYGENDVRCMHVSFLVK